MQPMLTLCSVLCMFKCLPWYPRLQLQSIIFLQTLVKILAQEDRQAWPKHNASLPHWRQGVRWAGRDPARSSSELGHTHPLDALLKSQNAPSYLILAVAPADLATKHTNSSVPSTSVRPARTRPCPVPLHQVPSGHVLSPCRVAHLVRAR